MLLEMLLMFIYVYTIYGLWASGVKSLNISVFLGGGGLEYWVRIIAL